MKHVVQAAKSAPHNDLAKVCATHAKHTLCLTAQQGPYLHGKGRVAFGSVFGAVSAGSLVRVSPPCSIAALSFGGAVLVVLRGANPQINEMVRYVCAKQIA